MSSFVDSLNHATMASSVEQYLWSDELEYQEFTALEMIRAQIRGRPILDLGVGTGRTVRALREVSESYVGVDYVRQMVECCQERFPGVHFEHADARSMPQFASGSFALIVFSCNGLGMVDHEGRIAILKEVYRLLEPGGYFLFSTANLNTVTHSGLLALPRFEVSRQPLRTLVRAVRFVGQVAYRAFNRLRYKGHEVHHVDYKIINDVCHDYRTMAYLISLENQRKQLDAIGFSPDSAVFDFSGHRVWDDTTDGTLTLVAAK